MFTGCYGRKPSLLFFPEVIHLKRQRNCSCYIYAAVFMFLCDDFTYWFDQRFKSCSSEGNITVYARLTVQFWDTFRFILVYFTGIVLIDQQRKTLNESQLGIISIKEHFNPHFFCFLTEIGQRRRELAIFVLFSPFIVDRDYFLKFSHT